MKGKINMLRKPPSSALRNRTKTTHPETLLEVLDASGKPLLLMPQQAVARQGLQHRAVLVCLKDRSDKIFVHKRPAGAALYPAMWDISACGHLVAGESHHDAAIRLLKEQLGIDSMDFFAPHGVQDAFPGPGNALFRLFITARTSAIPKPDTGEIHDGMFVDQEELEALEREFPEQITPFLRLAIPRLFGNREEA